MHLVSGTDEDGEWAATLPAGYFSPGDTLTYYIQLGLIFQCQIADILIPSLRAMESV